MIHPAHDTRSPRPAAGLLCHGAAALVLLVSLGALESCGMGAHAHRGDPTARAAAPKPSEGPKLTAAQERIEEAREQAALDPRQPYWPYRMGQAYAESESLARAEAALQASLDRDPGYLPALMLLSKLYYESGRNEQGVALLEAARGRAGADSGATRGVPPALLAGLALHYEALGRHDRAAAVVQEAGHAEDGAAGTARVYVTLRGDHPEAARELARAALDENPRSAANQNNYGITRLRAGDPKAARDAFLRAIEIDPRLPGPYYNLSIVERFFFFDEEAAARWLEQYRRRASDDPDNLFGPVARGEAKPVAGKER